MNLTLAYSPCPNDTFMFCDLAQGNVSLPEVRIRTELHDVETLNQAALKGMYDVTKMSFYTYLLVRDTYALLDAGAALGFGCGPVVIAKRPIALCELPRSRVALPGAMTTAHLLFQLWQPEAGAKTFDRYDQVIDLLARDEVDCAVIIHELRFTFEAAGFVKIIDLGDWWEQKTGCPIPLGCIGIKKELGTDLRASVNAAIRASIEGAELDPSHTLPYVRKHAQDMETNVLDRHITTFVNAFSRDLGAEGHGAVDRLEAMAEQAGLLA